MDIPFKNWKKWLQPTFSGKSRDLQNSRLLSLVLLFRGLFLLFIIPHDVVSSFSESGLGPAFALLVNTAAFFVARTRHYRWAARLIIIEGFLVIPFMTIRYQDQDGVVLMPQWFVVVNLISGLVLTARETAATLALTIVAFAVMAVGMRSEHFSHLAGSFLFALSCGCFILQFTMIRNESEKMVESEWAKIVHASKFSVLGEMAGGIAHEINNPLAIISLTAETLLQNNQKQRVSNELLKVKLEKITETADRISKIIQGLRSFARSADKDEFVQTDLATVIQNVGALCSEKFRANRVKFDGDVQTNSKLECRAVQIEQVLLNLLNNSFDAVKRLEEKWIRIEVSETTSHVSISVTDSGKGIPQHVARKIMQPFFTTKEVGDGTGLGLSISTGIIEDHGGHLSYDATRANTCFVMVLPFSQNIVPRK